MSENSLKISGFQLTENAKACALFPGQGAHCAEMLDSLLKHDLFPAYYEIVCNKLGFSLLDMLPDDKSGLINKNKISSLMTVLTSCLSYISYTEKTAQKFSFLSGYSVGQWVALHHSGLITFSQLIDIVAQRADIMDTCIGETGAMCAVIGLSDSQVMSVCEEITEQGEFVTVSNYNSVGQLTLAGTVSGIDQAMEKFTASKAKQVVKLPVSGAWHCSLLSGAAEQFMEYIENLEFDAMTVPVIDNVTGDFLPEERPRLLQQLRKHVDHPVRWKEGVKKLVDCGCEELVEIGYGNTLTRFGFFIDRSVRHTAYYC